MNWKISAMLLSLLSVSAFPTFPYAIEYAKPIGNDGCYVYAPFDASEVVELQSPTRSYIVEPPPGMELPPFRYIAPVAVIVMADEEFRSAYPNWKDYTNAWVDRADDGLYNKPLNGEELIFFDIDLEVVQYVAWKSDGEPWVNDMLADAETDSWLVRTQTPYQRELVIAFTSTCMLNKDINGVVYEVLGKCSPIDLNTIIIRPYLYPFDDNILMHEVTHAYFALDHVDDSDPHYHDDCIMSYEEVWVGVWCEDNGIWYIGQSTPKFMLTENYCSLCHITVFLNAERFNPPYIHDWWYRR